MPSCCCRSRRIVPRELARVKVEPSDCPEKSRGGGGLKESLCVLNLRRKPVGFVFQLQWSTVPWAVFFLEFRLKWVWKWFVWWGLSIAFRLHEISSCLTCKAVDGPLAARNHMPVHQHALRAACGRTGAIPGAAWCTCAFFTAQRSSAWICVVRSRLTDGSPKEWPRVTRSWTNSVVHVQPTKMWCFPLMFMWRTNSCGDPSVAKLCGNPESVRRCLCGSIAIFWSIGLMSVSLACFAFWCLLNCSCFLSVFTFSSWSLFFSVYLYLSFFAFCLWLQWGLSWCKCLHDQIFGDANMRSFTRLQNLALMGELGLFSAPQWYCSTTCYLRFYLLIFYVLNILNADLSPIFRIETRN